MFNSPIPTVLIYSPKDPSDTDEFAVDWSLVLAEYDDQISSVSGIIASPATLGIFDITSTSGQVAFYASGGVNGQLYQIDVTVTTNLSPSGRTLTRTVLLPVLRR